MCRIIKDGIPEGTNTEMIVRCSSQSAFVGSKIVSRDRQLQLSADVEFVCLKHVMLVAMSCTSNEGLFL